MTGQTNETQWYIARDGKQHGPLTEIEMRTFVAHNYLRQSDLIWKPGLPEWQPASVAFPQAFQSQAAPQVAAAAAAAARTASRGTTGQTPATDFEQQTVASTGGRGKRIAIAAALVALVGGGVLAATTFREPLAGMFGGPTETPAPLEAEAPVIEPPPPIAATPPAEPAPTAVAAAPTPEASATPTTSPATVTIEGSSGSPAAAMPPPAGLGGPEASAATAATATSEATVAPVPAVTPEAATATAAATPNTAVAALDPAQPASSPPSVDGSPIDAKLQKIPVWSLIKTEYPDWYATHIREANTLAASKGDSEVALHLAQGLVALRRKHAEQALAASPEKLQQVAVAFLDHLKSLRAQSVSACYGFISKGEVSPAVVQMLEKPETAQGLNSQANAIFTAAVEGAKSPTKHDAAVKTDYDILIKELSKLGWKDEDLQVFSNPKLLAKREPDQVCQMVQQWFIAHLAVPNKGVRERLLYETLKPVVSG